MSPLEPWLPVRRSLAARHHSGPPTSGLSSRIEVCPPQLWPSSLTLWGRLQRWLMRGNPLHGTATRPVNRLAKIKAEFRRAMDGLDGDDAERLAQRIEFARSLRELWHLRCQLYDQLSIGISQSEADARLARLNRHFPTRAQRSIATPAAA
jgi:hypothetical protein